MDMITAIFDPNISYEVMAARLRGVVERATVVVASMAYLAASLDDATVGAFVMEIVENYRSRLDIVRGVVGASFAGDEVQVLGLLEVYSEVTHVDRLRLLLEPVYGHARVRPLIEASGLNIERFIDALLQSL
jgi:hypothetical protein